MPDQTGGEPTEALSRTALRLRVAGRIALGVGLTATAMLIFLAVYLGPEAGPGYGTMTHALALTRENLRSAMWIAALVMLAGAGIVTWVVVLYASFRVAGPAYRFARNIELAMEGDAGPVPIRRNDSLQEDAARLVETIGRLREHYAEMRELAVCSGQALEAQVEDPTELRRCLRRLRAIEGVVRLDGD